MPIRIVHTADNHIGIKYLKYPENVRKTLVSERFDALERLVKMANDKLAHFFVVAGDLFDSTQVKVGDIEKTVALLKGFSGETVLIVPGNHDYCSGPDSDFWRRFRQACESVDNIQVLSTSQVREFEIDGRLVQFFPCPCPSKTGSDPTTAWVATCDQRNSDAVKIGIAHGNVTGLGLDAADQYFTMDRAALEKSGLTTWLLGHIHVPFPPTESGNQSTFFMAGIHTPDSVRVRHQGSAWYLECEPHGVVAYQQLKPGRIRFIRLVLDLANAEDIDRLLQECRAFTPAETVLDLQLSGQLGKEDQQKLRAAINTLSDQYLRLSVEQDLRDRIDAGMIAATYRSGSLAERLIMALVDDRDFPDAATLAHEIIQEVSQR